MKFVRGSLNFSSVISTYCIGNRGKPKRIFLEWFGFSGKLKIGWDDSPG